MRTSTRLVLGALALAGAGAGIYFATRGDAAYGLVVTPNPVDFGNVTWQETKRMPVVLRNASDHEIMVKDPKFNCTCFNLSTGLSTQRLAPGQSVEFEITIFTTKTVPGPFHKTLTLDSNDPYGPHVDIPMLGTIVDFRSVTPRQVALGAVESAGDPVEQVVAVRGGHGYSVAVTEATTTDRRLAVEVKAAEGGGDVVVRSVKGAAKGRIAAQVRIGLEVAGADGEKRHYNDAVWVNGEVR